MTRSQGRKYLWKTGRNSGLFLSAMRGEPTENGDNSTNSVSAKDDGTDINETSDICSGMPEELTLTLTPLLCDAKTCTKNPEF